MKVCACGCGATFEPKRSDGRFASTACRVRWNRAQKKAPGGGTVVPLSKSPRAAKAIKASADAAAAASLEGGTVTEATRAQLGDLESSVLGQTAMVLARRLDADVDGGSAVATMVKQLNALMTSLPVDTGEDEDPVLKARQALAEQRARLA